MKNCLYFAILAGLLLAAGCDGQPEQSPPGEGGALSNAESGGITPTISFSAPAVDTVFWETVFDAQRRVMQSPQDIEPRKALCRQIYFPNSRAIVTVGVGRLRHPETGQPLPFPLVRQAALADAARWASYVSTWLAQDYQPDFGQISNVFQANSRLMGESTRGDSLYVMMAYEY